MKHLYTVWWVYLLGAYVGIYMQATVDVQWDIFVQCDWHIYSAAYVNNVKHMYFSAFGDIVEYIEFM